MQATIEVQHLVKQFNRKLVLRKVDFKATPGEFVALVGPNGSGKTTFLRILGTLLRPSGGMVMLAGYRLPLQADHVRRCLGVVSHQPLLYGDLSAEENLRFYCKLYGVSNIEKRIAEVLELVGLDKRKRDHVRIFSRGMQQRLAIGRAVLHEPTILLLDEPYTGLDQDACSMLDVVLRRVSADLRTVVMASHDLVRISDLASRFDVLSRGVICASINMDRLSGTNLMTFYKDAISSQNLE